MIWYNIRVRNYNQKDAWSVQGAERSVHAVWGSIVVMLGFSLISKCANIRNITVIKLFYRVFQFYFVLPCLWRHVKRNATREINVGITYWIVHGFIYVPANKVQVIWETGFAGQKTQPTVSKYWRKKLQRKTQKTQRKHKMTYAYTYGK